MAENDIPISEGKKKKTPNIVVLMIIMIVVSLIVAAGTSFLIIKILSPNLSGTSTSVPSSSQSVKGTVSKVELIKEGSGSAIMLKGGKDIAVVDALYFNVASDECRSSIANNRIEILEAVRMIFLNKTKEEIATNQGQEMIRKQIKDAINEITGYTGEREILGVIKVIMIILTITSAQ